MLSLGPFYLTWHLTLVTLLISLLGGIMAYAFRPRPLFPERGKINAEVPGGWQAICGIRVVKAYTAEKREQSSSPRGPQAVRNVTPR